MAEEQAKENFAFRAMRRFKQALTEEECHSLLVTAKRGVLAVLGDGGYPYTVPLDFVYADGKLFFHCAKEGHKIDALRACDKASFCVLSDGEQEPGEWWYHFASVVAFGRLRLLPDGEEKTERLRALGGKYMPTEEMVLAEIDKDASRAAVMELTIEHLTGKRIREN